MAANSHSLVGGRTNFCLGRPSMAKAVTGEEKDSGAGGTAGAASCGTWEDALRLLKEGVWSTPQYEEWAARVIQRRFAPCVDFKR